MCNKYYPAIISPIERITHEFYVSFVIITWYIGSVIGSFMAIHLHTINRSKSELVLLTTGFAFVFGIRIETQLTIHSSPFDVFLLRIILGTLIGLIYLSSVIARLQSARLSIKTCAFTMATLISISQTEVSSELRCVSLTLIYGLIALNLSNSMWLFADNDDDHDGDDNVARKTGRSYAVCDAFTLITKQTRALIYLTGSKLLNIFCFFLPFICIASRISMQANVVLFDERRNRVPAIGDDDYGNGAIDVGNSNSDNDRHQIFNDLMVLLVTRLALGTITILLVRHNVNYLSIAYLMPLTIVLAIVMQCPFHDLRHLIGAHTIGSAISITIYIAFSLFVDIVGHHVALYANRASGSVPTIISLTYATFIEHLIDICIVVIYLNDWISGQLIITSFAIIFITIALQKFTSPSRNLIAMKYQIL